MRKILTRPVHSVIVFAALVIGVIVLSVTLLLTDMRQRELLHARLETVSVLQMLMQQTRQSFDAADLVIQAVQERLNTPFGQRLPLGGDEAHLLLSLRAAGLSQVQAIFLVDARGAAVNSSVRSGPSLESPQVADREYFLHFASQAAGKHSDLFIERPVMGRVSKRWTLHIARALENPDGTLRGVIAIAMSIPQLEQNYMLMKLDYDRPVAMYSEEGQLISSLPHREGMIGSLAPELTGEKLPKRGDPLRSVRHIRGNGAHETFAIGHLGKYPLLVGVTDDEVMSLSSWREAAVPIFTGAVLMCLFTGLVGILLARNVMRQERLSRQLGVVTDRYEHTVESVMDAIVGIDESLRVVLFNPAAEGMFGRSAQEVIGQPLAILLPERLHTAHAGHVRQLFASGQTKRAMSPAVQAVGLRSDGSEFPVESTVSRSLVDGQVQWTAVLRDVTQRRLAETELRELNVQLRTLYAAVQQVREEERSRISRELHDELGQQLTGLKLSLTWLGNRIRDKRETAPALIDEMRTMLDTATASVRRISRELRPPALDDQGFAEAVASMARDLAERSGFVLKLDLNAAHLVDGDRVTNALFRIIQESLTNVVRYASASEVSISLRVEDSRLVLRVADNGTGFDIKLPRLGIGMINMRERALSIGATFEVESQPGSGTVIEVRVLLADLAPPLERT